MSRTKGAKQRKKDGFAGDYKMVKNVDALTEFEKFRDEVLPAIRKDMLSGMSAEELYKKYQSLAAARSITIAASPTSTNGEALAAVKDILDRAGGKAKERSEVTHKMSNVPDEQLDAIILSKMGLTKEQQDGEESSEDDVKH